MVQQAGRTRTKGTERRNRTQSTCRRTLLNCLSTPAEAILGRRWLRSPFLLCSAARYCTLPFLLAFQERRINILARMPWICVLSTPRDNTKHVQTFLSPRGQPPWHALPRSTLFLSLNLTWKPFLEQSQCTCSCTKLTQKVVSSLHKQGTCVSYCGPILQVNGSVRTKSGDAGHIWQVVAQNRDFSVRNHPCIKFQP